MEYSEENRIDMEYVAIRCNTHIDFKACRELKEKGIITSHRDLVTKRDELQKAVNSDILTSITSDKVDDYIKAETKIKEVTDEYIKKGMESEIHVISKLDDMYPWSWKQLSGMPEVFFGRGDIRLLNQLYDKGSVSIVGSRKPSRYAHVATKEFAEALSDKGIVIVSGMAMGIDRTAHVATLNRGGATIAVLPCGPNLAYPSQNADVYESIVQRGLVISELPIDHGVMKQYFPARNRLIAGLTDVTLIMEASLCSGTLHTASFAASQGKDVMVLPNNIFELNNKGGLALIRDGAEIIIDVDTVIEKVASCLYDRLGEAQVNDDIESIRTRIKGNPESVDSEDIKKVIIDDLSVKPLSIDEIVSFYSIPFARMSGLVVELENEHKVAIDNGKYILTFRSL